MRISLDPRSMDDYHRFLRVKSLPQYRIVGRFAEFPDEYAGRVLGEEVAIVHSEYKPMKGQFDYQEAIARMAIQKQKFAVFADCGLGKTLIELEFARHAASVLPKDKAVLIVSPLMVVKQTVAEAAKFYGKKLPLVQVRAHELAAWLESGDTRVGITNYDAMTDDLPQGRLGALILDESSMLKSHYGKWGTTCIRLGRGIAWKLAATGTPAPNDRIEYANHAVFLDHFPTVNAFLARFFVNRGQTDNRWELKPHALEPFYRALSHWAIFLTNPATYGWKDNTQTIPPIRTHIDRIDMTDSQTQALWDETGNLFADKAGGITTRSRLARIAKGCDGSDSRKPAFIVNQIENLYRDESIIVWCHYNAEQEVLAGLLPDAANISGETPIDERERLIEEFKAGRIRVLITKPRILGFGLNLQIATRHIFSGLQDSYEEFYQAVKRSNRVGSRKPLDVHIPITDIEAPMIENVLNKARRVQADTEEQERIFRNAQP